jgi:hypothetical protein
VCSVSLIVGPTSKKDSTASEVCNDRWQTSTCGDKPYQQQWQQAARTVMSAFSCIEHHLSPQRRSSSESVHSRGGRGPRTSETGRLLQKAARHVRLAPDLEESLQSLLSASSAPAATSGTTGAEAEAEELAGLQRGLAERLEVDQRAFEAVIAEQEATFRAEVPMSARTRARLALEVCFCLLFHLA